MVDLGFDIGQGHSLSCLIVLVILSSEVKMAIHYSLVLCLRMSGAVPALFLYILCYRKGQFYLYLYCYCYLHI
jgi:hypothetical protein